MKIRIRMVSGKEIIIEVRETDLEEYIDKWLRCNWSGIAGNPYLKVSNIESVERLEEE